MLGVLVLLLVFFLGGTAVGIFTVVCLGIRLEERRSSLSTGTSDSICLGARKITGTHVFTSRPARTDADVANQ